MNKIIYVVPASLLCEAASLLQPPERLCFATGCKLFDGRIIFLNQLVPVEGQASRVHVTPNPASLLKAQKRLWDMGLQIEGQLHSHPGFSSEATHASHIDLDTARRWERGSHP